MRKYIYSYFTAILYERYFQIFSDSTLQQALNYYNEETIAEAEVLLHNKAASGKRLMKRQVTKGKRNFERHICYDKGNGC